MRVKRDFPSRNCANCRAVKRRCDKQRPHCGQCIRTRETCHGPKTPDSPSPTQGLHPDLDEVGANYFLHNFIIGGHSASHGYLNYIPTVYSADGEHPTLVASMAAVGLVALANLTQQPELVRQARTKYSEAINRVNTALSSPVESLKDSILMSVISLGIFEHVSNLEPWARHVRGAAALLVARGKSQFSSTAALLMFNQVRTDLVVACIHSHKPFTQDMWKLQEEAMKHFDPSRAFWLRGVLAARHTNLVWEETALRRDFQHVLGLLVIQEPYTSTQASDSDPDVFHNGRSLQYYILPLEYDLATNIAAETRAQLTLELEETLGIQSKLEEDMLATVPQGLGFVSLSPDDHPHFPSTNVSGGYMLTWCLFHSREFYKGGCETRQWIIHRLRHIGRQVGNAVALQLLEVIGKIDKVQLEEERDKNAKQMVDAYDLHK
ncbi:hypothetical protein BJX63DRAFT_439790 [Aspergillus granulosus]|uniref:Zn(2)-C6 fungal-type domain-containing protein n=1 Tax=Aspergillus granulosus TaxID=176169 RepID=A0ABR4GXM9_9EURO